jgi:polyisoprenyl-phosphate glycosyltransferase
MGKTILAIVVPCYNEEDVLNVTAEKLQGLLSSLIRSGKIHEKSFICFVDDGSADSTWSNIQMLHQNGAPVKGIKLSRNWGHQRALLAGVLEIKDKADCIVTIDADLQDDFNVIEDMIEQFHRGCAIVYGVRNNRDVDHPLKRNSAQLFYLLLKLLGVNTIYNHADFRLTSRKVIEELSGFKEVNLYLRGLFPLIGLKSSTVFYERKPRRAGESKYPFRKMASFAWDAVTSFSTFPMRLILSLGIFVFFISFLLMAWAFILALQGVTIPGWASTVIPIYLLGGLQMACLGLLGEYIGKIYAEVKSRPRYIVEEELMD